MAPPHLKTQGLYEHAFDEMRLIKEGATVLLGLAGGALIFDLEKCMRWKRTTYILKEESHCCAFSNKLDRLFYGPVSLPKSR